MWIEIPFISSIYYLQGIFQERTHKIKIIELMLTEDENTNRLRATEQYDIVIKFSNHNANKMIHSK